MRRLYFRIYLAVLGSIALFAILVGLSGWVFHELREPDNTGPRSPFISDVAEHLLPAGANPAALAQELEFWHNRTKFGLALLSAGGEVIARAGAIPDGTLAQFASSAASKGVHWHPHGAFAIQLDGGRQLIAIEPPYNSRFLFPLRWLGVVFAIGLAVAISAYPLVRRLTRNLEQLQQGVAAFGQGNLKARVAVRGRDEVGKLAETFNASADRIEALMNAQKRLLANASHELRSPLARLRMAAEAIGEAAPKQQQEEIARDIAELDGLVDEILLASRSTPGRPGPASVSGSTSSACSPRNARRSRRTSPLFQASPYSSKAMPGFCIGCSAICSKTRGGMAAALSRSRPHAASLRPWSWFATTAPVSRNRNAPAFSSPSSACPVTANMPAAQG